MNQSSPNKNFWIYNGCWSYSSILSRGMQWLFDSIIHKSRGGCGEKTPRKPEEHYHKTGCAQKIARSYWFEHGTMPLGLQHFLNQKIFATKAAKSPMVRFSVRCLFFLVATIFFSQLRASEKMMTPLLCNSCILFVLLKSYHGNLRTVSP